MIPMISSHLQPATRCGSHQAFKVTEEKIGKKYTIRTRLRIINKTINSA